MDMVVVLLGCVVLGFAIYGGQKYYEEVRRRTMKTDLEWSADALMQGEPEPESEDDCDGDPFEYTALDEYGYEPTEEEIAWIRTQFEPPPPPPATRKPRTGKKTTRTKTTRTKTATKKTKTTKKEKTHE